MTIPDLKTSVPSNKAAEMLAVTLMHIGDLCRRKKLKAEKVSGIWFIEKTSLAEYKKLQASLPPRGRKARMLK